MIRIKIRREAFQHWFDLNFIDTIKTEDKRERNTLKKIKYSKVGKTEKNNLFYNIWFVNNKKTPK